MRIKTGEHTGQKTFEGKRLRIYPPYNQWKGLFGGDDNSWTEVELIKVLFEYAPYKRSIEIQISLLGFCWCVDYWYGKEGDHSEVMEEALKRQEMIEKEGGKP